MDLDRTPRRLRREGVSWCEVDGEVVVLDLRLSEYLSVNRVGARLWSLLQAEGGASPHELAEALVERYGISLEQAARDVEAFLEQCQAKGLLEVEG